MRKETREERSKQKAQRQCAELDDQYGNIGISAVAAALPYTGKAKNPAYAPSQHQSQRRSQFDTRSIFAD
jgi:hypothetical protein